MMRQTMSYQGVQIIRERSMPVTTMNPPKMIVVPAIVQFKNNIIDLDVTVDTGFSGGLFVDRKLLSDLKATFVRAPKLPITTTGEAIPGKMTQLHVELPEAGASALVDAFCPDEGTDDTLLGVRFLAEVGASVTIGTMRYRFQKRDPKLQPNRGWKVEPRDLSDWVIRRRPANKYW